MEREKERQRGRREAGAEVEETKFGKSNQRGRRPAVMFWDAFIISWK